MKTERTATYSSLLSFPYLVLRTKAKRKREGVVHEIRQYLGGGALCVQMDFTQTFQTTTKCNNMNHV